MSCKGRVGTCGCRVVDERIELLKTVEVTEDPASGGNKIFVTLELPLEEGSTSGNLSQFFLLDDVKRLAIKEASKTINKAAGWSDIGRLRFYKDGEEVAHTAAADAVRVIYTCLGAL